jgi:hypothetical protein
VRLRTSTVQGLSNTASFCVETRCVETRCVETRLQSGMGAAPGQAGSTQPAAGTLSILGW